LLAAVVEPFASPWPLALLPAVGPSFVLRGCPSLPTPVLVWAEFFSLPAATL